MLWVAVSRSRPQPVLRGESQCSFNPARGQRQGLGCRCQMVPNSISPTVTTPSYRSALRCHLRQQPWNHVFDPSSAPLRRPACLPTPVHRPLLHSSVAIRTLRCDNRPMTSREFIRRAKDYARKTGQSFRFDPTHGKGSHGRVYVGARFATVQRGELQKGVLAAMLRQLRIDRKEF